MKRKKMLSCCWQCRFKWKLCRAGVRTYPWRIKEEGKKEKLICYIEADVVL
jgi:hypothetical protein